MLQTVKHIVQERRASGTLGTVNDLLDRMLTVVDRQSGEKLDDTNIIAQCITFLIAGHETTSGLLSFALYALLKNPDVLARAYDEVDRVLGTDLSVLPTYAQIHQVAYVDQILEETLRLWPTAPAFTRHPHEDTVIGGKYRLEKETSATILTAMLHRDKQVWGENPEKFDPDRFSPENRARIPPNAYKPFGTGQRACIGRQFAMQEAILVLSMLLQRFEFVDFADYQLETKQTLTIKPNNFHIKVKLRDRTRGHRAAVGAAPGDRALTTPHRPSRPSPRRQRPVQTRTKRGCWCSMAPTWAQPRAWPMPSPRTRGTAGSWLRLGRSTTTSVRCRKRGPWSSSPHPTTASRPITLPSSASGFRTLRYRRMRLPAWSTASSAAGTATGRRPTRRSQL